MVTYKSDFIDSKLGHGVGDLLEQDGAETDGRVR